MSFENDLLISYAHIDDQSLLEGQPGWVSTLHRILEIRVAQLLGEKPRIWRDPKLQGNDYFADTILVEQLPKVAALLTVLSPRYVQSEWCTRELEAFCRASETSGGVRIADKARIFKVVKTPIPQERHPEPLQPLLGYEFYVTDPQTGRPRELSHFFGPEAERQFLARLDDLAWDVCQLLQLLRANGNGAQGRPAAPKATVYLAETSVDLREEREAIRRDLLRNGYEVLPNRPLPLVASELEAFVQDQLADCALSVHLIGRGYGVVPDGGTRSTVAVQHDTAAAQRGLPRLIWLSPGAEVEDDRQRSFLAHLRTAPGVHAEAELLEISLEDLKGRIHLKLAPPEPKKEKPAPAAGGGLVRIYLICDQADQEAARPVEDFLFDRGFEVVPTLFDEDEAQARLDHEESLCTCDAVLLFQGQASEMWLRRKLREVQKSAGLGRQRPLLAQGLYLAAPQTPQKERFRTLEALVLREPAEGFSPAALESFLAEIVRQREARA
ncbi:MAG TPA: hypothetical protein VJ725_12375 [Thermoanaerobaculia bacterium]|nr:hypothetical protein [Thermoanaerobaculia bacterium]